MPHPSSVGLVTMLIYLKTIVRNLILPPAGPLLVAIVGLLLAPRRRKLGMALTIIGVGSLWLFSTPVFSDLLSRMAERYPPLDPTKPVSAQAIVILGGGGARLAPEFGGWSLERATLDRMVYGAFLERRTALPILVSGSPDEAAAMKATLTRDLGIPPRWIEGNSHDTYQNVAFSTPILRSAGIHRILLITTGTMNGVPRTSSWQQGSTSFRPREQRRQSEPQHRRFSPRSQRVGSVLLGLV